MIISNLTYLVPDLYEIKNLFTATDETEIRHTFRQTDTGALVNSFSVGGRVFSYENQAEYADETERKRLVKRYAKLSLYKALSGIYKKEMPWGALTGIRPTKLAYQAQKSDGGFTALFGEMRVSEEKTRLTAEILEAQKGIYSAADENCDLFVFIPFCPTKCGYCSFVTSDVTKTERYIRPYVDSLIKEIDAAKAHVKKLRSVYVGGGTPVALPAEELEKIMNAIGVNGVEYTVEAGRPDQITEEYARLFAKYGVTRVCVNPQTLNEKTLAEMTRKHSVKQFYDAYGILKDGFSVNVDLIAGLPGESAADFKNSLDGVIKLAPDNVTVHSLCLKSGSALKEKTSFLQDGDIFTMIDYAYSALTANGYSPYYLYRQKYMKGNLENTGYAKPGRECVYNIDVMEEISSVIACGANAVSKRVYGGGERIERYANPKDLPTYLNKLDEIISRKKALFS